VSISVVHPFHFTVLSTLRHLAHAELSLPHNCQLEPLAGLLKLRTLVLPLPLVGGNSAAAAERWDSIGGEPHLSYHARLRAQLPISWVRGMRSDVHACQRYYECQPSYCPSYQCSS